MEKLVYIHTWGGETEGDSFGTSYYTFEYESKDLLVTALTCECIDFLEQRKEKVRSITELEERREIARKGGHKKPIDYELSKSLYSEIKILEEDLNIIVFEGKKYDMEIFLHNERTWDRTKVREWELQNIEGNIVTLDQWFNSNKQR